MLEHVWSPVKQYEGSPYEERLCSVCLLKDGRNKDNGTFHRDAEALKWYVTTPCIEPVPDSIDFDALIVELAANPVSIQIDYGMVRTRTFDDAVFCTGRPGAWRVGLYLTTDGLFPERPDRKLADRQAPYPTIERASAELLRWMRARQYDPYMYSDLRRRVEMDRTRDSCCHDD